jgi:hypothetical protein
MTYLRGRRISRVRPAADEAHREWGVELAASDGGEQDGGEDGMEANKDIAMQNTHISRLSLIYKLYPT